MFFADDDLDFVVHLYRHCVHLSDFENMGSCAQAWAVGDRRWTHYPGGVLLDR